MEKYADETFYTMAISFRDYLPNKAKSRFALEIILKMRLEGILYSTIKQEVCFSLVHNFTRILKATGSLEGLMNLPEPLWEGWGQQKTSGV